MMGIKLGLPNAVAVAPQLQQGGNGRPQYSAKAN